MVDVRLTLPTRFAARYTTIIVASEYDTPRGMEWGSGDKVLHTPFYLMIQDTVIAHTWV
jgi:hypothetical protein